MANTIFSAVLMIVCSAAFAQVVPNPMSSVVLDAPTTFPIIFTSSIAAKSARSSDPITAKTTEMVHLEDGAVIPKGARITGHVVAANPFMYDSTPYARQKASVLSIHFDSVTVEHQAIPLRVTVRAMADPLTSEDARTPINHDIDPSGATMQIGADQRYPWNAPVINEAGDVVGYSRHGGVYAHLIASGGCDGSAVEVAVGIYSASACGLYGFDRIAMKDVGSLAHPSTLTLVSTHSSVKIWKDSTALLEVLPRRPTVVAR